ncbi:hypothetical protein HPB50_026238 [Hyalomma asiaticum]|uniref:Uncharacterized protein n=1 Tax=Hyalomma asiaticum TaxID=266040 RepID=A0ACB7SRG6_HYAAI|nr:hypothetical protein HPB50_026238 [Hyalomma asiaticum]
MTWGARSLVRIATMAFAINLALRSAKASEVVAHSTESTTAGDRLRRDSDQMSEVFIEHVNGADDSQAALSIFIGLLILGGVVIVVLIFLGCLLLVRMLESSRPPKYHRLYSSRETYSDRRPSRSGGAESQVFTYVDLTNADGHEHQQLAPRFLAKFQKSTIVDSGGIELRRNQQQEGLMAGTRRSHVARTGAPFSTERVGEPYLRRTRSEEVAGSNTCPDKELSAADRTSEPPRKRLCVRHVSGTPKYRSGYVRDERGSDYYGERSVNVTSDEPQMEVSVRDSFVKVRPRGELRGHESPLRSHAAHAVHQAAPRDTIRTTNDQPPEQHNWSRHPSDFTLGRTGGVNAVGPFRPWVRSPDESESSPPLFPNNFPSFTACARSSEDVLRSKLESNTLTGHGRFYEQHPPDEGLNTVAGPYASSRVESSADCANTQRDRASTACSQPALTKPFREITNVPGFLVPNTDSVSASSSATVRKPFEHDLAEVKPSSTSTGKSTEGTSPPLTIKAKAIPQTIPSQPTSGAGPPHSSESRELMVRVPGMVTHLDHPEAPETLKTTFDGDAPNDQMICTALPAPQLNASPTEGLSPVSPINGSKSSRQLRLPQPPREKHDKEVQTDLRGARSASKHRYSTSARRHRRGGHTSGELVVVDAPADEQASDQHHLPKYDVPPSQLDISEMPANSTLGSPQPETSLVPYDSPPLGISASTGYGKPADPVTAKADVSVTGPWAVVGAECKPMQPYNRNIAVMTDIPPDEADEQGENSDVRHIGLASESSAGEQSGAVESKSDQDVGRLTATEAADLHDDQGERPAEATTLEDGTIVESRVPPKWLPVERTSRELISGDQPNQQLATVTDRALTHPISHPPIATVTDAHLVTLPAPQGTLVSSSPTSGQGVGSVRTIDDLETSAIEAAGRPEDNTRTLDTAGRKDLDSVPSTDIAEPARTTATAESPEQGTSVAALEGQPTTPQMHSSSSTEVKERAGSTDMFFTRTSPVVAQGSKDLISFNNEPPDDPQAERSVEERTNTVASTPNASAPKDEADKR